MLNRYSHLNLRAAFLALPLLAAASMIDAAPVAAQSVESFYKGKQMRFIIRSATGGGYDLYGRLVGRHIVNHIPGKPTIIPQNMPGGMPPPGPMLGLKPAAMPPIIP